MLIWNPLNIRYLYGKRDSIFLLVLLLPQKERRHSGSECLLSIGKKLSHKSKLIFSKKKKPFKKRSPPATLVRG